MPWTKAQHRFFCAIAHGMKPRKKGAPSKAEAARMCKEGVKSGDRKAPAKRRRGGKRG